MSPRLEPPSVVHSSQPNRLWLAQSVVMVHDLFGSVQAIDCDGDRDLAVPTSSGEGVRELIDAALSSVGEGVREFEGTVISLPTDGVGEGVREPAGAVECSRGVPGPSTSAGEPSSQHCWEPSAEAAGLGGSGVFSSPSGVSADSAWALMESKVALRGVPQLAAALSPLQTLLSSVAEERSVVGCLRRFISNETSSSGSYCFSPR